MAHALSQLTRAELNTLGVVANMGAYTPEGEEWQSQLVEYIDGKIGELMDMTPPNTHFIVTADHGELFGEDGYFGHGPIMHEKCFEVPFVEGRLA